MSDSTGRKFSRRGALGLALAGAASVGMTAAPVRAERIATKARIVIIGAGAGGLALANRLVQRLDGAQITLVDGRAEHFYQPGLSLVAAGLKPAGYVVSRTVDWLPSGVTLIDEHAAAIDPEARSVSTLSGQRLDYDFLVVAPGLVLDHDAIQGFSLDMVGRDGIGALYAGPDYAARTWDAARRFADEGGVAISTRPATEMKCAGAPLKHTFLIEDVASRGGAKGRFQMHYACPQPVLFSVPIVAEKVRMLYAQRGIATHYGHTLSAIEPGRKTAIFTTAHPDPETGGISHATVEMPYDYLHVIPRSARPM